MIAWYWGLVNALLVTGVIWLNGRGLRVGWLAGVATQAWIVAFGLANGSVWFTFSVLPLTMFAYNWWRHKARMARVKADMFEEFADRVQARITARTTVCERCPRPARTGTTLCRYHTGPPPAVTLSPGGWIGDHIPKDLGYRINQGSPVGPDPGEYLKDPKEFVAKYAKRMDSMQQDGDAFDGTDLDALHERAERINQASRDRRAAEERRQAAERAREQDE